MFEDIMKMFNIHSSCTSTIDQLKKEVDKWVKMSDGFLRTEIEAKAMYDYRVGELEQEVSKLTELIGSKDDAINELSNRITNDNNDMAQILVTRRKIQTQYDELKIEFDKTKKQLEDNERLMHSPAHSLSEFKKIHESENEEAREVKKECYEVLARTMALRDQLQQDGEDFFNNQNKAKNKNKKK